MMQMILSWIELYTLLNKKMKERREYHEIKSFVQRYVSAWVRLIELFIKF